MKKFDTLVRDIYSLMEYKKVDPSTSLEAEAKAFGEECEQIMLSIMQPDHDRSGNLRLSAVGKPKRQQYYQYHGVPGEEIEGATYIKFAYGHLIEALLVAFAKMAGHEVKDQQKVVHVAGVKGHIDGIVDGELMDIKSASSKSFKKFEKGELYKDDGFGYVAQGKAYAHALGHDSFSWLVMDKTTGRLCTMTYDLKSEDKEYSKAIGYDIEERIEGVKEAMGKPEAPPKCYQDEPVGKSGNRKLAMGCVFCPYKHTCWENLREFQYSNYTEYLTVVDKTPRVPELPSDF